MKKLAITFPDPVVQDDIAQKLGEVLKTLPNLEELELSGADNCASGLGPMLEGTKTLKKLSVNRPL